MAEIKGRQIGTAQKNKLMELFRLFLRLGLTAFGGPAAHIAMMQREVVDKRGWMDHDQFLDLIGATNLIPGPNSTEMALHIGQERAGWRNSLSLHLVSKTLLTGNLGLCGKYLTTSRG